jgi:hypothetical protein
VDEGCAHPFESFFHGYGSRGPTVINDLAAYFAESLESHFGVVDPEAFEQQLTAHYRTCNRQSSPTSVDGAWYALRNAVFSSGSRADLARKAGYKDATKTAMGFFRNAMSVYAELIYSRPSVMATQALVVMVWAFYAME